MAHKLLFVNVIGLIENFDTAPTSPALSTSAGLPVLTLAFDTSTRTGSIAVLRDHNVLGELTNTSEEPYSITFLSDLDRLLVQLDLALHQFDLFAVGSGPGSFTGVRTGLTAAKAWSEIYGKPIASVSCLAALAFKLDRSRLRSSEALIAAVSDARRGQIFGCVYRFVEAVASAPPTLEFVRPTLVPVIEEVVLSADEFIEIVTGLVRRVPPSPNSGNDGPATVRPATARPARYLSSCLLLPM